MNETMPSQAWTKQPKPEIELQPQQHNLRVYLRRVEYRDGRVDWLMIKPGQPERPVRNIPVGADVLSHVTVQLCNNQRFIRFNRHDDDKRHWYGRDCVSVQTHEFVKYAWNPRR